MHREKNIRYFRLLMISCLKMNNLYFYSFINERWQRMILVSAAAPSPPHFSQQRPSQNLIWLPVKRFTNQSPLRCRLQEPSLSLFILLKINTILNGKRAGFHAQDRCCETIKLCNQPFLIQHFHEMHSIAIGICKKQGITVPSLLPAYKLYAEINNA